MQPYYFWGMRMVPIKFLFFLLIIPYFKVEKRNGMLFLLLLGAYSIVALVKGANIFGSLEFLLLAFIPFLKTSFVKQTYGFFTLFYASLMSVSLIVWGLVMAGFSLPNHIIDPLNELKHYVYIAYPFLVVPTMDTLEDAVLLNFMKFHSVFDESGVVGTISLIILYINSFNLKKWYNIIILISGIVSFSLFFYACALGYSFFYLFKNVKIQFHHILAMVAGISVFIILVNSSPMLYDLIGKRFEYDKTEKKFVGDNRADDDLKRYVDNIRGTSVYFWGDTPANIVKFSESAGYRNIILRYGAVFFALFILFWILYAKSELQNDKKSFIVFIVLFIAIQYQRPGVNAVEYLFLYTAFLKCNKLPLNSKLIENGENSKINEISFIRSSC